MEENGILLSVRTNKMLKCFLEKHYFFKPTNLLMEIKGLVMYPKG
jgi:hypothetical protein